jgi:hypothetical protein
VGGLSKSMTIDRTNETCLLHSFASGPSQIAAIEARVQLDAVNRLSIHYVLTGDLSRLRIPPLAVPHRRDRLWEHTCFEAFMAVAGAPAYYEYNFAPSGAWAVFAFRAYRDGASLGDQRLAPEIASRCEDGKLELTATVQLDQRPMMQPSVKLRFGLSAVIEATDGSLSYWALKHPAAKPDFHHPDSFVLEFALPGQSA